MFSGVAEMEHWPKMGENKYQALNSISTNASLCQALFYKSSYLSKVEIEISL